MSDLTKRIQASIFGWPTGEVERVLADVELVEKDNAAMRERLAAVTKERGEVLGEYRILEKEWQVERADSGNLKADMGRELAKARAEAEAMKSGVREACMVLDNLTLSEWERLDRSRVILKPLVEGGAG